MKRPIPHRFCAAVRRRKNQLPSATYWRYSTGRLPPFGFWLLAHPEEAAALAQDAQDAAGRKDTTPPAGNSND